MAGFFREIPSKESTMFSSLEELLLRKISVQTSQKLGRCNNDSEW